jgi:hypothetical protein
MRKNIIILPQIPNDGNTIADLARVSEIHGCNFRTMGPEGEPPLPVPRANPVGIDTSDVEGVLLNLGSAKEVEEGYERSRVLSAGNG